MTILDKIDSPRDLRNLSIEALNALSEEIRDFIIKTVSKTGGHIAPSLGVIELTLALHYVFDTPADKLVWDVGHQTYAHKIITGRREKFYTLRQLGGISGFPKREESEYDVFNVGHSSTSISAAEGIYEALKFQNKKNKVIAIIGDGAFTGGLAYEGLNNVSSLKFDPSDFIVILNDNSMSIAENVGGISRHLNRIITGNLYNYFKETFEITLKKLPHIGENLVKLSRKIEEYLKGLISPGILFEEFGFRYFGPIDGHDIKELINMFEKIKSLKDGPFFIHIVTKKGKGFDFAEKDPTTFHGLGPFNVETGKVSKKSSKKSYTKVFGETLTEIAKNEKKIVAITAAMPTGTGLDIFQKEIPDRFYDVGIAEGHAVTFAAGLAVEGMMPVVAIYSTFLQRAYDEIIHDVALQNLPVFFCLDRAGIVGEDGPTHHGAFDISYLKLVPNMVIMSPKNEIEFKEMIKFGINYIKEKKGPIALRYHRGEIFDYPENELKNPIKLGKGEKLLEGKQVAVLTLGREVKIAYDAIQNLNKEVSLYNLRFAKPIDENIIEDALKNHEKIVIIEENTIKGGIYETIASLYVSKFLIEYPNRTIVPIAIPDKFITHGKVSELLDMIGMSENKIKESLLSLYE